MTTENPIKKKAGTEVDLVRQLKESLEQSGYVVSEEVPSHGRARTDLVLWDGEILIGVEAKLRDWGRVIGQAALNRQCVDQSYLAMWSSAISDMILAEAARFGIGVMSLGDGGAQVVLQPTHGGPIPELRQRLIGALESSLR